MNRPPTALFVWLYSCAAFAMLVWCMAFALWGGVAAIALFGFGVLMIIAVAGWLHDYPDEGDRQ